MAETIENSRRFYEKEVAPLIKERFGEYEDRIAVGLAGEGSDCFGYEDFMSRDHDFGTGVCLWVGEEDMHRFGFLLSIAYNELVEKREHGLTDRLRERRGVMTVHDFYSNILNIDCDTDHAVMSDAQWRSLDHSCLATAVNGEVFRDDAGSFTEFRKLLLSYYPDHIWRERLATELHAFSQTLQVNYARCMTRKDLVAAECCRSQGMTAAMQVFFLLKREYPPYYKWTYRRLCEIDEGGFAKMIRRLAGTPPKAEAWERVSYDPNRLNLDDPVVAAAEQIAMHINTMLRENGLTRGQDPYLERYVDEMIRG